MRCFFEKPITGIEPVAYALAYLPEWIEQKIN